MPKKRRVYISRAVGNQVMTLADLERLHKYMVPPGPFETLHLYSNIGAQVMRPLPQATEVA